MPNLADATRVVQAYMPNRKFRRENAGQRCSMCGIGITAPDLALVEIEVDGRPVTRFIHNQCVGLLFDLQDEIGTDPEEEQVGPDIEGA